MFGLHRLYAIDLAEKFISSVFLEFLLGYAESSLLSLCSSCTWWNTLHSCSSMDSARETYSR